MNNFEFQNPTKLIFGKDTIPQIAKEIPAGSKVMVTYGGGSIKSNGIYDQVIKALSGFDFIEFGGIEANPQYETLLKAMYIARENNIDFLLAVGGGSVIDGTKFIAVAINYKSDDPSELLYDRSISPTVKPIPIGSVLTLPATGSEMNNGAVISRKERGEKNVFYNPWTYPTFSILDPQACYSLPKKQISNGLADTFCHVLEQYAAKKENALLQDRFAEGILLTLKEIGVKCMNSENNYDLMSNYMFCATMGLNGFIAMGVTEDWATHLIGHEITAMFGLDHGVTLAIVGPSLYNVLREQKKEKLIQYGERVWGINCGSDDDKIDAAIKATREWYESIGIKTHLSDYGIDQKGVDALVEVAKKRNFAIGEDGNITPEVIKEILEGAL